MTPATLLEHDGIDQPITEWALDYGITPAIIIARLDRGQSVADAITTPMQIGFRGQSLPVFHPEQRAKRKPTGRKYRTYTHNGERLTLAAWALRAGINKATIRNRIESGWSMADALSTPARAKPGVVWNFTPSKGTGAGSTLQETPNITFSQEAAE